MGIAQGKVKSQKTRRAPKGTKWTRDLEVLRVAPSEVLALADQITDDNRNVTGYMDHVRLTGRPAYGYNAEWLGCPAGEAPRAALERQLREGWKEGEARMIEARRSISDATLTVPLSRKPRISDGHTSGPFVNVGRALNGDPFAYARWERKTVPQAVKLVISIGGNAERDADALVWKGVVAMVLADLLTEAGYRTEITVLDPTYYSRFTNVAAKEAELVCTVTRLDVKRAEDPLILDLLASVTASPLFFRAGLMSAMGAFETKTDSAMGTSGQLARSMYDDPALVDLADALMISHECFSREAAIAEINRVVALLNEG